MAAFEAPSSKSGETALERSEKSRTAGERSGDAPAVKDSGGNGTYRSPFSLSADLGERYGITWHDDMIPDVEDRFGIGH